MDSISERLNILEEIDSFVSAHAQCPKQESDTLLTLVLKYFEDKDKLQITSFVRLIDDRTVIENRGRDLALIFIRLLSNRSCLPTTSNEPLLESKVVDLCNKKTSDICKTLKISHSEQTFESIEKLSSVHATVTASLATLNTLSGSIQDIHAQKQQVFRALSDKKNKAYLHLFNFEHIAQQIRSLFSRIDGLIEADATESAQHLNDLSHFLDELIEEHTNRRSFVYTDHYIPMLKNINKALNRLREDWKNKFDCSIAPLETGKYKAEKRYPLHEEGREIFITIPLINKGTGKAFNVTATISAGDELIVNTEEEINDIVPGRFHFVFSAIVSKPAPEITLALEISWQKFGSEEVFRSNFDCTILAQRSDVPWEELSFESPYSTEVAEGSEFVGRSTLVKEIASKFISKKMQSCFLTGQKRIGKTSLARAAVAFVTEKELNAKVHYKYIEWGEFAAQTGEQSIELLGKQIAEFIERIVPGEFNPDDLVFPGSLQPLFKLVDLVTSRKAGDKLIFVIDEFDEIHSEMYHHGTLAESFFASLRTLSSRQNVGFLLVGGENLPFIMSQQGDQLNKFVQIKLDYFSETDEYDDYATLIRDPVKDRLNWSDESIRQLFDLTHGHPYYTKLACAEVFSRAVKARDAEITRRDIDKSLEFTISGLASNSFQHHWMDGIPRRKEDSHEAISERLKLLAAIAKISRLDLEISLENISKECHWFNLEKAKVKPLLDEFCKRNILEATPQGYRFTVPIFHRWLREVGPEHLIADRVTEEAAAAIRLSDDQAYVRDSEISEIVSRWDPYQGRKLDTFQVRHWLSQVSTNLDRRLLFTLLRNLRFVKEEEIRSALTSLHRHIRERTPVPTTTRKGQKRGDILVVYLDGEGKSGQYFASKYAEQNLILTKCIINAENFKSSAEKYETRENITVSGIVVVDDIVATGNTMAKAVGEFIKMNKKFLTDRNTALVIVSILYSPEGETAVERTLNEHPEIDSYFGGWEAMRSESFAFKGKPGIWRDDEEYSRALKLCQLHGGYIEKKTPLGYGDQGLLVVFPSTCPNNSLPILRSSSSGANPWHSLFPRAK